MKSILFLGYSNLIKNRILPILKKVGFDRVEIAKYEGQSWDEDYKKCDLPLVLYDNFKDGLSNFNGDLVYISTVNSTHVECARKSLGAGFNTIVDKPATFNLEEAKSLVTLAKTKGLFLGESTVYLRHPQLCQIKNIFKDNEDTPKLLTVHFTMPPFQPNNFRYQKKLGGGAIMDTSPYAVSIGRYFFNSKPDKIVCNVSEKNEVGLDIEYSLLMSYPEGKTLIGHFGFNTEYINEVHILGNRTNVHCNRIFTIPDNIENKLQVDHLNKHIIVKSPMGNNFELYLKEVLIELQSGNFEQAYNSMLMDAEVKQMIFDNLKFKI